MRNLLREEFMQKLYDPISRKLIHRNKSLHLKDLLKQTQSLSRLYSSLQIMFVYTIYIINYNVANYY
jgi:hypothetical protein